jgi:hypothetical protein
MPVRFRSQYGDFKLQAAAGVGQAGPAEFLALAVELQRTPDAPVVVSERARAACLGLVGGALEQCRATTGKPGRRQGGGRGYTNEYFRMAYRLPSGWSKI